MTSKRKYYAIGFKQWVEIRSSLKPIVEEITEARVPPQSRLYTNAFKIKVVHHKGGKVLKVLKGNQVEGIFVGEGQMIELPPNIGRKYA